MHGFSVPCDELTKFTYEKDCKLCRSSLWVTHSYRLKNIELIIGPGCWEVAIIIGDECSAVTAHKNSQRPIPPQGQCPLLPMLHLVQKAAYSDDPLEVLSAALVDIERSQK